jgi:3-hydroxy acid dehydrogenase/malonic semialdehyde reductase
MRARNVCLVTGASSGIGEQIARHMVERGWLVVAVGRRTERLDRLRRELGEANVLGYRCDVSAASDVASVSRDLKAKGLIPSLFFLNAGAGWVEGAIDPEVHRRTFEVNYFGALYWIEQWLLEARERGANFVAVSSLAATRGAPHSAAYGASKAALKLCVEALQLQYADTPVRFTCVQPGPVRTAMLKAAAPVPFTWTAERAARHIVRQVLRGRESIRFPLFWSLAYRVLASLPAGIAARVFGSHGSRAVLLGAGRAD